MFQIAVYVLAASFLLFYSFSLFLYYFHTKIIRILLFEIAP